MNEKHDGGTSLTEGASVSVSASDAASHAAPTHTPGPWEVQTHLGNGNINRVMPLFRRVNVGVLPEWEGGGFYLKNVGDAHLIAAAPEMKEALIEVERVLRQPPDAVAEIKVLQVVRAAIRKSEGRS